MDRWSQSKADVAIAIWDRLLGCFGDALLRKYGAAPPQEWVGALSMLTAAQHERGLRRLVFGWKGGPPSLPDFMRLCRAVGTDEFDEGQPTQPLLPSQEDAWDNKPWEIAGNLYLRGHIAKRLAKNAKFYGEPASYRAMQASDEDLRKLGLDKHCLDASGVFVDNVAKLVAAKNAWVEDMRDLAVDGKVPPETQKAVWYDYFNRAEAGLT